VQAKIRKDGDVTVVELEGRLDFETAEPFREKCQNILSNSKVVFNLSALSFVGSSGIGVFVNTLREFSQSSPVAPKFCNLKSEFKKVFRATDESFQIFEDENSALSSFSILEASVPKKEV
jgi:anti-sigma B factor antagonist